jgi:hypothetical protein
MPWRGFEENTAQRAADLKGIVDEIKRSGVTTVRGIANEFACAWHPGTAGRHVASDCGVTAAHAARCGEVG